MNRGKDVLLWTLSFLVVVLLAVIVTAPRPIIEEQESGVFSAHQVPRSGKWPKVEKEHLEKHPLCRVCEEESNIKWRQVHHILDFHDNPELELDPNNLITLCGVGGGCKAHFWLGHDSNFKLPSNPHIREDAALMNKRWKEARKKAA